MKDKAHANPVSDQQRDQKHLIQALASSALYRDYAQAFSDLTKLPIALRPVEVWTLPYRGHRYENPFCSMMARWSKTCACCLQTIHGLSEIAMEEPAMISCTAGLTEIGVPIRLGQTTIGFLQTGQVFKTPPNETQLEKVVERLRECSGQIQWDELRKAYFDTPVLNTRELRAIMQLLRIFSDHLASLSNRLIIAQNRPEPMIIHKAKQFIEEHYTEPLSLTQVARAVNTSTFYFCKIFKKYTGINFTEYVSRVRVERAKTLAMNPNLRISDIAYEVGFQSLTHFNRVFKRITGLSPTEYRAKLLMYKG